jgi:hypothetical protein
MGPLERAVVPIATIMPGKIAGPGRCVVQEIERCTEVKAIGVPQLEARWSAPLRHSIFNPCISI